MHRGKNVSFSQIFPLPLCISRPPLARPSNPGSSPDVSRGLWCKLTLHCRTINHGGTPKLKLKMSVIEALKAQHVKIFTFDKDNGTAILPQTEYRIKM